MRGARWEQWEEIWGTVVLQQVWRYIPFNLTCDSPASAQYHWRSTLQLLPAFTDFTPTVLHCTQQCGRVCFPFCRTYAAHMNCTEMWCRDADVTALYASCGFEVELSEQRCLLWPAAVATPRFPRTHGLTSWLSRFVCVGGGLSWYLHAPLASEQNQPRRKLYPEWMNLKSCTVLQVVIDFL